MATKLGSVVTPTHYKTYGYQTVGGCDLLLGALIHKTTRLFDHMITWCQVAN